MPKEYQGNQMPQDYNEAETRWFDFGQKGNRKFYFEVRETREFGIEDILEELAVIYGLRPEDFSEIKVKKQSGEILENVELTLKPELSVQLFGHEVSFDFTVEGKLSEKIQSSVTNISRTDYYPDGDIGGESLADYDRVSEKWIIQPRILPAKKR